MITEEQVEQIISKIEETYGKNDKLQMSLNYNLRFYSRRQIFSDGIPESSVPFQFSFDFCIQKRKWFKKQIISITDYINSIDYYHCKYYIRSSLGEMTEISIHQFNRVCKFAIEELRKRKLARKKENEELERNEINSLIGL